MNKNKQALYLSGLISEDQLTETSDSEHSMALAQGMKSEFEAISGALEECLLSCVALEKKAMDNYAFHDNTGMGRVDSQGVGDAGYFEDVLQNIKSLTRSLRALSERGVDNVEKSLMDLINRLNANV